MGHPGKRAPTVQICDSEQPFEPVAERQHALGAYPLDPNLIAQGIAPDDRVDFNDRIFAPSSAQTTEGAPPPVAVAQYSPSTGQFVTPDGHAYRQSDLVSSPKTWTDLLPIGG
jgi:hypothetical protein